MRTDTRQYHLRDTSIGEVRRVLVKLTAEGVPDSASVSLSRGWEGECWIHVTWERPE